MRSVGIRSNCVSVHVVLYGCETRSLTQREEHTRTLTEDA
jgi:hypothetical protein